MEKLLCELWRIAREVRFPAQRFHGFNAESATALCNNSLSGQEILKSGQIGDLEGGKQLWVEVQSALCGQQGAPAAVLTLSDPRGHMFGLSEGAQRRRCRSIHALSEFHLMACFATSATVRDRPRRPMKSISDILNPPKDPGQADSQPHGRDAPEAPVKRFGVISRQQLAERGVQDGRSGVKNARTAAQSILSESLGYTKPRTSFAQILKSGRSKAAPNPAQKSVVSKPKDVRKEGPPKRETSGEKVVSILEVEAPKLESLPPPPTAAPRAQPSWKVGLANREQRAAKAAAKDEVQRLNEEITAKTVRLVELDGKGSSIMSIRDAMAKAKQAGVDLVEVNGRVNPPVCKLVDYKKFKFDAKKREKERKKQEVVQRREKVVKEIRLSSRTDYRDMEMKARVAKEHLALGYQIRCFVQFKKGDRRAGFGEQLLPEMLELLKDHGAVNKAPRATGGRLEMYLRPLSLAERKRLPEYKKEAAQESSKKGGVRGADLAENEDEEENTEAGEEELQEDEDEDSEYVDVAGDDTEEIDEGRSEGESSRDETEREDGPDSDWEASVLAEDVDDAVTAEDDDDESTLDDDDDELDGRKARLRERGRKRRGGKELNETENGSDLENRFAALDADFEELGENAASKARRAKLRDMLPRKKRWSDQLRRPMRAKPGLKHGDSDSDDERLEMNPEHFDVDGRYLSPEERKKWDS